MSTPGRRPWSRNTWWAANANVSNRPVTPVDQVTYPSRDAGAAVDVGPGGEGRVVPHPAEGDARDLMSTQPGRPRILMSGVGQHKPLTIWVASSRSYLATGSRWSSTANVMMWASCSRAVMVGSTRKESWMLPSRCRPVAFNSIPRALALRRRSERAARLGRKVGPVDLRPDFGHGLGGDLAR